MPGRDGAPALFRGATAVALVLWVVLVDVWFAGPLLGRHTSPRAALPLALVLAVLVVWISRGRRMGRLALAASAPRLAPAVITIALVATLVRLPALRAPGGLMSSDSAVAGIIAQELRAGQLPAPVYPPGFPYEGTLKPHLTALLALVVPGAGTPLLYTVSSHLFFLLWIGAVMALARRTAGMPAAWAAGAFMSVSPRFLAAFSLNNVGQYPEVNGLGALALALLAGGNSLLLPAFVTGVAVWQQLLGVYFVVTLVLAALVTPELRRAPSLAAGALGFVAGSYPVWIWNAAHGLATLDLFRRAGKNPADRLGGLPERLQQTFAVSFPKMFGLTDLGLPAGVALVLGLGLPALVVFMAWRRRREILSTRGRSPAMLCAALLAVTIVVFAVSKFSYRGAQRPRYLMPVYTSVAVALGWGFAGLLRRSRPAALVAGAALLALDAATLVPWLGARAAAQARDDALVDGLVRLGVRTGYSGFWIAPKYTFLAEGRFVLSAELGPDVSWVHPAHSARVRHEGPDAYVVQGDDLALALATRLDSLGVRYEHAEIAGFSVFHHLSRRVALEEVSGYDRGLGYTGESPEPE